MPHASDLLAFIQPRFDFCLGGAAYPEGHREADSLEKDLSFVKLKVEQGAQFIITQYTYDSDLFLELRDRCRSLGIVVPIVAADLDV